MTSTEKDHIADVLVLHQWGEVRWSGGGWGWQCSCPIVSTGTEVENPARYERFDTPEEARAAAVAHVAERIAAVAGVHVLRAAQREISGMLDGFPSAGRHTRARWAVAWLDVMIDRAALAARPVCDCAPDCAERIACEEIGTLGHMGCGWCEVHDQARHICLCQVADVRSSPGTLTCRWCPPDCKSCEPDDCECYTHQDEPDKALASACGFHAWGADDRCVTCGAS